MERGLLGDKYEPVKRIGHGSYGSVYLAKPRRSNSSFVVLKRVFVVEEGAKEHLEAINEVLPQVHSSEKGEAVPFALHACDMLKFPSTHHTRL